MTGFKDPKTFGILDGNPAADDAFGGVPLVGDTDLDKERLNELLARLQAKLSQVRGE